jgi:hypothetical protein
VSVLQGTFETLSLPEVLGLLASARKSGALWLDAGPIVGVVHLEDGHCRATESGELRGPVEDGPALLMRLVDICFAVMRQETGSFRFVADEPAPWMSAEPVELSDAMVEVDRLLKQWQEILRVIPSLDCRPRLLETLEVDEIVVDRERWSLLIAIDGRLTVRELVQRLARPVMDVCHALLELVESGAVGVIDPAAARPSEPVAPAPEQPVADQRVSGTVVAPPAPPVGAVPEPVAEAVPEPVLAAVAEPALSRAPSIEPVPAVAVEPPAEPLLAVVPSPEPDARAEEPAGEPAGEQPDKGAFLRLFSGLRES